MRTLGGELTKLQPGDSDHGVKEDIWCPACQDVHHFLRAVRVGPAGAPAFMLLRDHLSPVTLTPRAGQTVQAVCVSLAQSFIMWLGASALLYKSQSPLGQHGNGREEHPPAQHSGLDMYKPTSSSYCFRDKCLMPMMGAVCVSQSYCLGLSEDQCSF